MYLKSARSLILVSLLNISTIGHELMDELTPEEQDNLNKAWEHLEAIRKTMTARIGHDTTLEA